MNTKISFYNTLGRETQEFKPNDVSQVRFYSCGPTVYDYAHIGNLRYFTFVDILRRTLEHFGYNVNHVMNITDVGHLSSDGDLGEDKMLKALARESQKQGKKLTVWDVAKFYTDSFLKDMSLMNIQSPSNLTPATEHIQPMIDLIQKLVDKGFAYVTPQAVYFDVTKFAEYSKLSGQKVEDKKVGTRDELVLDPGKKHPADFRLWQLDQPDHAMQWESPWGKGFPGWHIECSAMAMEYLGETLDIHTGGIDHIPVHHTNEIAQSEAASGKSFAKYWLHSEFLKVDGEKMSKSKGNGYNLSTVTDKGYSPLELRYFYLSAHYRTPLNFTWEAMDGVKSAYENLTNLVLTSRSLAERIYGGPTKETSDISAHLPDDMEKEVQKLREEFDGFIADDLNIPGALSVLWKVLKSQMHPYVQYSFIEYVDHVLGFEFMKLPTLYSRSSLKDFDELIAKDVLESIEARNDAKTQKNWTLADEIRTNVEKLGFVIVDTSHGSVAIRKS